MGKLWKTHYFDWAMFNSYLLVYQRVSWDQSLKDFGAVFSADNISDNINLVIVTKCQSLRSKAAWSFQATLWHLKLQ